jgi:hypothetical protein
MKYAKLREDSNWDVIESDDDEQTMYLHGWYKLVDHEEPHESWNPERWRPIEHLQPQDKLRILHRFHRIVPIDAYEPERSTLVFAE